MSIVMWLVYVRKVCSFVCIGSTTTTTTTIAITKNSTRARSIENECNLHIIHH